MTTEPSKRRGTPHERDTPIARQHLNRAVAFFTIAAALTTTSTLVEAAAETSRHNPRVEIARDLNQGLANTPMRGQGFRLERTGRRWNVSPYFIALASGRESSFGTFGCRSNPRNVWGLKSCRTGPYIDIDGDGDIDDLPTFRTWGHAFTFFARYVRARFPHATTPYHFHGYCECGVASWAGGIDRIATRLGWPTGVKYPVRRNP